MKEKEIIPEIINLKPNDILVEYDIDSSFSLKNQCNLRGIKHFKYSEDHESIKDKKILIITFTLESKLKRLKEVFKAINEENFYSNVFLILDFGKASKNIIKRLLFIMKYFFVFNINYNPFVIYSFKKHFYVDNLFIKYPNYLNRFFYYSLKLWIKKFIIMTISFLNGNHKFLIYKVKIT